MNSPNLYPRQTTPTVSLYKSQDVQAGAIDASSRDGADTMPLPNLAYGYVAQDSVLTVLTLGGDPQRRVSIGSGAYIQK